MFHPFGGIWRACRESITGWCIISGAVEFCCILRTRVLCFSSPPSTVTVLATNVSMCTRDQRQFYVCFFTPVSTPDICRLSSFSRPTPAVLAFVMVNTTASETLSELGLMGSLLWSSSELKRYPLATVAPSHVPADSTPKQVVAGKKICCACPETKAARDNCIVINGEEACKSFIDVHKQCLREQGFNV